MDPPQRAQVRLILEHQGALRRDEIHERIRATYARNAAIGLLKSGSTIKAVLRAIDEIAKSFVTSCIDETAKVAMDIDAFALVQEALFDLQRYLRQELSGVVKMATGHSRESGKMESAYREADRLFEEQEARTKRQLEIHRFSFTKPAQAELGISLPEVRRQQSPSRGGRPLAPHWDQVWAAIAVQLYLGDLKPLKQADIENAMKDWFATQGLDAGDTPIRDRARVLWRKIEESE